jgi:hypothetical protein
MTKVVYNHRFKWKETKVNLSVADAWIRDNIPYCTGTSATVHYEAHFTVEPTEEQKAAMDKFWAEQDNTSYVSRADKEKALAAFKERMLISDMKKWGPIEKKVWLSMPLDSGDWEVILG